MSQKSTVQTLPAEILQELNQRIADGDKTLDDLVLWLEAAGHKRSRSSLHRHSQKIERAGKKLRQSREIAEALVSEIGDDLTSSRQGRLVGEMLRVMAFDYLQGRLESADPDDEISPQQFMFLGRAMKEVAQAMRLDQDYETKIREEARQEALREAAASTTETLKSAGIKKSTREKIEKEILGLNRE